MLNKLPKLTAVVPCLNESENLPNTLKRLRKVVDEIIVVDNGSIDDSPTTSQNLGATVILEPRKQNKIGYGYALQTGLNSAQHEFVITIDADGEHPIEQIPRIVKHMIKKDLDFVSCNRVSTKSHALSTKIRRLGILILSLEVTLLFQTRVQDILSGMWVIRRNVIPQLNLKRGDWNLSPEIKLSAINNENLRFAEYPIHATVRKGGESKQILWKTAIQHGLFILNYRLKTLLRKFAVPRFTQTFSTGHSWEYLNFKETN